MNITFLLSLLGNWKIFNYLKLLFIFLNKSGRLSSSTVFLNKALKNDNMFLAFRKAYRNTCVLTTSLEIKSHQHCWKTSNALLPCLIFLLLLYSNSSPSAGIYHTLAVYVSRLQSGGWVLNLHVAVVLMLLLFQSNLAYVCFLFFLPIKKNDSSFVLGPSHPTMPIMWVRNKNTLINVSQSPHLWDKGSMGWHFPPSWSEVKWVQRTYRK